MQNLCIWMMFTFFFLTKSLFHSDFFPALLFWSSEITEYIFPMSCCGFFFYILKVGDLKFKTNSLMCLFTVLGG